MGRCDAHRLWKARWILSCSGASVAPSAKMSPSPEVDCRRTLSINNQLWSALAPRCPRYQDSTDLPAHLHQDTTISGNQNSGYEPTNERLLSTGHPSRAQWPHLLRQRGWREWKTMSNFEPNQNATPVLHRHDRLAAGILLVV